MPPSGCWWKQSCAPKGLRSPQSQGQLHFPDIQHVHLFHEPIPLTGRDRRWAPWLEACSPGRRGTHRTGPTRLTETLGLSAPFQGNFWEACVQAHSLSPHLQGTHPGPQTHLHSPV